MPLDSSLVREWIIAAVRIAVPDVADMAMVKELRALVACDLTPGIDVLPLECGGRTSSADCLHRQPP